MQASVAAHCYPGTLHLLLTAAQSAQNKQTALQPRPTCACHATAEASHQKRHTNGHSRTAEHKGGITDL